MPIKLVGTDDPSFPDVFEEWVTKFGDCIIGHLNSNVFTDSLAIEGPGSINSDRYSSVVKDIQKNIRKFKDTEINVVLIAYPTFYVEYEDLVDILKLYHTRRRTFEPIIRVFSTAYLSKQVSDWILDEPIPDVSFIGIHFMSKKQPEGFIDVDFSN